MILPLSFSPPIIFSVMRGVINVRLPFSVPCSDHGSDRGLAVGVTSNNVGINTVSSPLCAHLSSHLRHPRLAREIANRRHVPAWRILFASMVCLVGLIVLVAGVYSNIVKS